MKSRMYLMLAAVGAGGLLLTGCGSGASDAEPQTRAGGAAPPMAVEAAPGADAGSGGGGNPNPLKAQPAVERDVIYTAELRISTDNVDQAANQAKKRVADAGGHVADEDTRSEPGVPPTVRITFKIPADRYKATLDQLSTGLGTRLSLQQGVEDVTDQVADVDSRVKSAEEALESYRRLLSRAETVDEILSIEREISQRESDLESLQARQRALGEQTSYATVTVHLGSTSVYRTTPQGGGFVNGLKSGWDSFRVFLNTVATVFGWLLPFLVTGAILAVPVRWLWRLARRRRRAKAESRHRAGANAPFASMASPGRTPPGGSTSGGSAKGGAEPDSGESGGARPGEAEAAPSQE